MATLSPYSKHFFTPEGSNNSWSNMYNFVPAGSRVLDVGCSTGNFGAALEELKGCSVIGIDINEQDIIEARTKISEAYVLDITQPNVAEQLGLFDAIIFADVIEHLVDPRAALRATHALLAEDGLVVYSIPHMGHMSVRLDLLEGRFPYTELGLLDRTHLHFYDRLEVHDVFSSAGFRIVGERPTVSSYPQQWIDERLAALGLTATPTFYQQLQHTEADVYQYIGAAAPDQAGPLVPAPSRKEISPPDEILERASEVLAENQRLSDALIALQSRVRELKKNPVGALARELKRRMGKNN